MMIVMIIFIYLFFIIAPYHTSILYHSRMISAYTYVSLHPFHTTLFQYCVAHVLKINVNSIVKLLLMIANNI